jgi:hypothetical protein
VYEKLLRKDMQDRIRHLHEILQKIAGSVSRYSAKALARMSGKKVELRREGLLPLQGVLEQPASKGRP